MTVSTQESIIRYKGNDDTTVYQIPFRWLEDTDIIIQKQDAAGNIELLTYLTDYTLTGETEEHGGYVTFVAPFLTTDTIVIQRVVPYTQETDYEENEIFPADSHEEALDKLTMEVQQLAEESSRALKINVFSTVDPEDVVNHVERVYQSVDNIDAVSKDLPNVDIVAENIDAVKNTGDNIQSVITASDNIESIKKVTSSAAAISITAANIEDVKTTAKNINDVKTVATNIVNVNKVANNEENINTVVNNIVDINNASANAQSAKTSAQQAKQSETNAKSSAAAAKISEDNAKASEISANKSETNAKVSENNAKDWADKAEDFYNKSETLGDYVQISLTPTPTNPISKVTFEKKCTEKQFLSIYVDRVKLLPSEYTLAPDGMSVTLSQPVSSSVPLEVDYFVGMSNTVAEDLQQQINDITAGSLKDAVTTNTDQIITGNKSFTGTITAITQPNTDNSINVATTAYVKNVLDEASPTNMVTTDTNQTITASKTLTASPSLFVKSNVDITTPPETIQMQTVVQLKDTNEGVIGNLAYGYGPEYCLGNFNIKNKNGTWAGIYVYNHHDSTKSFISGITPPKDANAAELVTADWINSKFQVVAALPENADDNTFYFIY